MKKKIVIVDVGSEIIDEEETWIVDEINIKTELVITYNPLRSALSFDDFIDNQLLKNNDYIKSINDIPVDEIEKVLIRGYNDIN